MTDSALKTRIQEDMKTAMRAKETERLGTIRMLLAALKQKEVDERVTLSDTDVITILNRMIKQRNESASQFQAAGRNELADKEKREIVWLSGYLPQQLSEHEIDTLIDAAISTAGASLMKEMGAVMSIIKTKAQGRVDMAKVSERIKNKLK